MSKRHVGEEVGMSPNVKWEGKWEGSGTGSGSCRILECVTSIIIVIVIVVLTIIYFKWLVKDVRSVNNFSKS